MASQGILERVHGRWRAEGGYREVLAIAVPLILSTGAWSIQHFVDRMFLAWHSRQAVAAVMPAGLLNFTVMSLFLGTAGYVGTFVAQYHGARQHDRIGPIVWQGVYIAVVGGMVHLLLIPFAEPIFRFVGHEPAVQRLEATYFRVLCLGAGPAIASAALSGFFNGRGRTWPVMWVQTSATVVNLVLDYALIFGKWGLPAMGIKGAAIATVASGCYSLLLYLVLLAGKAHRHEFRTWAGWRFRPALFARLLRFGFPNGVQFFVDIAGFSIFVLIVGRLGEVELAATTIAFNINTLAFMPMIGAGTAVSVMVGQYLTAGKVRLAERSVWSGFHLSTAYMATFAAIYVAVPGLFVAGFASASDPREFAPVGKLVVELLRFVALYSLFDSMNLIFAAGIKGAGDTRYVMVMLLVMSTCGLVVPTYVAVELAGAGIYGAWVALTAYIVVLAFAFLARFLGGKWKAMRVIEEVPPALPPTIPESPVAEV